MWHFYPVLIIAVLSLIMITLVSAIEKRLVWPYVPEKDAPPASLPVMNTYATVAASAATEAGFSWLGTFADGKGKLYHLRYDFFLSPTRDVLAIVGTGTMASVPMQTTWLSTLLADGKCLVTVDHQNGVETDLAGIAESALAEGLGFFALVNAHRARVALASGSVQPFSEADPLGNLKSYRQNRTERLCALGYASFLSADKNSWRYSIKGAFVLAFRQYFTGLRRAISPDKIRAKA